MEQAGEAEAWKCCTPEKRAQRLALCHEENREGSLCPCSVDSKNFLFFGGDFLVCFFFFSQEGEELAPKKKKKKFWQSTMHRYREGATLYKKRNHQAVGFTFSWSGLGLATLCSFGRVCAASADGR